MALQQGRALISQMRIRGGIGGHRGVNGSRSRGRRDGGAGEAESAYQPGSNLSLSKFSPLRPQFPRSENWVKMMVATPSFVSDGGGRDGEASGHLEQPASTGQPIGNCSRISLLAPVRCPCGFPVVNKSSKQIGTNVLIFVYLLGVESKTACRCKLQAVRGDAGTADFTCTV
jgi:hypothetical protein